MGFFADDELPALRITRMNFQVVGEGNFEARPAMRAVEQADFFLDRILDVDVGAAFEFAERSTTRDLLHRMARGAVGFAPGAVALAEDFHGRHVGQSKPGAFFVFELECGAVGKKLYALLKYDYSEVLTLRRANAREQLQRVVQAFVKDKRALQKSALVRVVNGIVEAVVAVRDRAMKAPDITDFFSGFLGVLRNRDDVELNREALAAINELAKQAPEGTWPQGKVHAIRTMRQALRDSAQISEDVALQAALVAAGRPQREEDIEVLRQLTERVWRRRKLRGLEFAPAAGVFQVAQRRRIKTVERIQLSYPDELTGVRVVTEAQTDGSTRITIHTEQIESNEIDNESLGDLRRLVD